MLGISGGERERLEMDGTRAGRFANRGEGGSGGDLTALVGGDLAAFGSATRDIFAFTRTFTFEEGVFSSGSADEGRTGEEHTLPLLRATPRRWLEDVLTLRSRVKEEEGALRGNARLASDSGDVELKPFVRGVS